MSVHPLNCFSQNRFYWNSYGRIILALVFLSGISGIAYSESEVELGISEYSKTDEAHRKLRQEKNQQKARRRRITQN